MATPIGLRGVAISLLVWPAYFLCLGWHAQKHVQPDGSRTGPYSVAQVALFILLIGAISAACARDLRARTVSPLVSGQLTAIFLLDHASGPDAAQGLYVVGASFLLILSCLATLVWCLLVRRTVFRGRQKSGSRPQRT